MESLDMVAAVTEARAAAIAGYTMANSGKVYVVLFCSLHFNC